MQNGEAVADSNLSAGFQSREKKIIFLLCLLAAVHVFIFSAAFPFFNNVDEPAQFDNVLRYAHGQVPRGMETTSREASVYLALFCSCAYLGPSVGALSPPPWKQPVEKMRQDLVINSAGWQTQKDYEASEPPLYYALTGLWWHMGKGFGLAGGRLLYWLRFINVITIVALVWLAYATACMIFPGSAFIRLAVPALAACMPQTAFYSIGNDTLSPLFFGATFYCLIKWLSKPSPPVGALMGLAFAAAYLAKATNIPLLAVAAAAMLTKAWQETRKRKFSEILPGLAAFIGCAIPPIVAWMLWCKFNYGGFTGSRLKAEHFGWTVKPFGEWWPHPIFTPWGFWTFLSGNLATFWQGEFQWYYPPAARPLALPGSGVIYTLLSLILIGLALPALFSRFCRVTLLQRRALRLGLAGFLAALGFFAVMSIVYDFHDCPYPSRPRPYFTSGRLLLGAVIPFLLLFVYGLDRLLARFKNTTKFTALAVLISAMLIAEIATDWPAFFNDYNWFHLP